MKALLLWLAFLGCLGVLCWAVYSGIDTSAKQIGANGKRFGEGGSGGGNGIMRAAKVRWSD